MPGLERIVDKAEDVKFGPFSHFSFLSQVILLLVSSSFLVLIFGVPFPSCLPFLSCCVPFPFFFRILYHLYHALLRCAHLLLFCIIRSSGAEPGAPV